MAEPIIQEKQAKNKAAVGRQRAERLIYDWWRADTELTQREKWMVIPEHLAPGIQCQVSEIFGRFLLIFHKKYVIIHLCSPAP